MTAYEIFPSRAGVLCCGKEIMPIRQNGPMRGYQCPECGAMYTLMVKPRRRPVERIDL